MPTAGSAPELLVDTSVAVALLLEDHEGHASTSAALRHRSHGLAGHAAFETYSVLTRLPAPLRRPPVVVRDLLEARFPASRFLPAEEAKRLLSRLAEGDIGGGAVYDALVGATALAHGLPLVTRDRRAAASYRRLDVAVEMLAA